MLNRPFSLVTQARGERGTGGMILKCPEAGSLATGRPKGRTPTLRIRRVGSRPYPYRQNGMTPRIKTSAISANSAVEPFVVHAV
jgi:hypothetical protein